MECDSCRFGVDDDAMLGSDCSKGSETIREKENGKRGSSYEVSFCNIQRVQSSAALGQFDRGTFRIVYASRLAYVSFMTDQYSIDNHIKPLAVKGLTLVMVLKSDAALTRN